MSAPTIDLTIPKGKTFELALLYASDERVYVPITAIPSLAPVRLTAVDHGMPDGWPFEVVCMKRPAELNGAHVAKVVDQDTIEINSLVGDCWRPWAGGGIVVYQKPEDIGGWSARAMFRRRIGDSDPVLSFHSDPGAGAEGRIIVDAATSSFTLELDADIAEQLPMAAGVWDAEAIDPDGRVYPLVGVSEFRVEGEVTR